jgi:hypothetical protein
VSVFWGLGGEEFEFLKMGNREETRVDKRESECSCLGI